MQDHKQTEEEFSFKRYFVPLTTVKAITWVVVVGFIVYFNSLFNSFVGDDYIYIINFLPSHTVNLSSAFGQSVFNTAGQYRPLAALFFSILYTFFGTNAFFYHIVQLFLHIVCAILLFVVFRKFFSLSITFFSTLIFLVHPLQVESVVYIAQMDNEIFFIFGILAFLLSLKKKISVGIITTIGLLLLFSFLAKETGVLFFLLIITYSFLFNRKHVIKFLSVGILSLAIYGFIRYSVGHVGLDTRHLGPIAMAPLSQRLISLPAIVFYYVKSFVYPVFLAYDQQWVITSTDIKHFYFPLIADILFFAIIFLIGFGIIKKEKKNLKLFLFFCVWFFSGLGLIMQIYPLDATVADRWFYFPLAGLLGIIGLGMQLVIKRYPNLKTASIVTVVGILVLLSVRTIVRNTNWTNSLTIFSHDVKVSENPNIDENLAYELISANQDQEGIIYLQKSVEALPDSSNLYDLGILYEKSHAYIKAEYYYSLSLAQKDRSYGQNEVRKNAYDGLARVLTFHDNPENAKKFLDSALKVYPQDGSYWVYLAIVDYTLGDQNESLAAAEKAKTLLNNSTVNLLYYRIVNKKPLNVRLQ